MGVLACRVALPDIRLTMNGSPEALRDAAHLEHDVGVLRFDDLAVIELTGDDTRAWLNGQVTNDVRATHAGDAVYALFVTVKGRIMADVWVCDAGEGRFQLLVPRASVARLLESFDGQIIMEDVEPKVRDDLAVVSLLGPEAAALAEDARALGDVFPVDRLGGGGLDVLVRVTDVDAALDALARAAAAVGGARVSMEGFELARVRAKRPRFGVDFDDHNYPQETGLEPRAVSFDKGCYLGQEVICMLENRGKLQKRLCTIELAGDASAAADARIESEGVEVGRVTTVADDADRRVAFGYVKRALANPGQELTVGEGRARVVEVLGAS